MTNIPHITRCGLPGIDRVPFGWHACHFYKSREQLAAALVPYAVAGLRGNERCLLVTAPPLPAHDAVQALCDAWEGASDAIRAGALRVLDCEQWYLTSARLKGASVVDLWLEEEERALAEGYSGLRIAGNTSFLTPDDWASFVAYEHAVTAGFNGRRIVALCAYALAQCDERQMSDVMRAHHCTLEGPDVDWRVFAVPGFGGATESFT